MKCTIFIYLLVSSMPVTAETSQLSLIDVTLDFCVNKGAQYITFVSNVPTSFDFSRLIRSRRLSFQQFQLVKKDHLDYYIFILHNEDEWNQITKVLPSMKRQKSVLVFMFDYSEEKFSQDMSEVRKNAYFYVVDQDMTIKQVITLTGDSQVIINKVSSLENGQYVEPYDLQGLNINCIGLSYLPNILIYGCDSNNANCQASWLLADLQNAACDLLNCTWSISEPNDGHGWGVKPISGPFTIEGVWGGVLGGVINDEYMCSISDWFWLPQRDSLMDFAPHIFDNMVLAVTPQRPHIDLGLFVRPFTASAWKGIGITFAIIIICLLALYSFYTTDTDR